MERKFQLRIAMLSKATDMVEEQYTMCYEFKTLEEVLETIKELDSELGKEYHYYYYNIRELNKKEK